MNLTIIGFSYLKPSELNLVGASEKFGVGDGPKSPEFLPSV
jgi:hypothetical protein